MSENVVIYIVDKDDYDFSRVQRTVATKEEVETDYNTLILVYDSYQKKCIGGVRTKVLYNYKIKKKLIGYFKEIY